MKKIPKLMIQGKYLLIVIFFAAVSCEFVNNETIRQKDIINLEIEANDPLLADGSEIILKVTIPANASEEFRKITFEKSNGTFLGVNAASPINKVNEEGIISIGLRLPLEPGPLFLRATAGTEFPADTTLYLNISYPDNLLVEPQSQVISKSQNSAIVINVKLTKSNYKSSIGIPVEFYAIQASDTIGRFVNLFNATSNSDGIITATLQTVVGEVKLDDPVIINVCGRNDANEKICNTAELIVIE